jgi:malonyl-ACP decarboxylase
MPVWSKADAPPVVVTGIGAITPIGHDVPAFTAGLRDTRHGFRRLPPELWPALTPLRVAAPIVGCDIAALLRTRAPDPETAQRWARTARGQRPAHLLALAAGAEALGPARPARYGVVVAGSNLGQAAGVEAALRVAAGKAPPARHGAEFFDSHLVALAGACFGAADLGATVGAATASAFPALAVAHDALIAGRVDAVLLLAPPTELAEAFWRALDQIGALAPAAGSETADALCRPFDAGAGGFVPGEAAAALLLERREAADRRGVRALAALASVAMLLDGSAGPAAVADSEAAAMRQALEWAGLTGDAIDLVSAHATSTPAGDAAEATALAAVFGSHRPVVNALKGLIGHALGASGLIAAVAAVVQLGGGFIHGNRHLDRPVAPLAFAGPAAQPARLRHALVTGYGFGGFNAAAVFSGVS